MGGLERLREKIASRLIRRWHVHLDEGLREGIALLCGAGEDISFDLGLQARAGCRAIIADPTPRAIEHVESVLAALAAGGRYPINNSSEGYDFAGVYAEKIRFVPLAIWTEASTLKFWAPAVSRHVSHSAVNLQGTSHAIEVEAATIEGLIEAAGGSTGDLRVLKLDVEGAEGPILKDMVRRGVRPTQVLVEFDELQRPARATLSQLQDLVDTLDQAGYRMAHFDGHANAVFLTERQGGGQ